MAYNALKEMRNYNLLRFKQDVGPMQPKLYKGKNNNDLKSSALRFIHNSCEDLNFGTISVKEELKSGVLKGASLKQNQIPFNMEKDVDRICLERSLEEFIDSGTSEDAYLVYYCYLEMFFNDYGKSKKMIELLSEYEMNGSSLLMKHRDHFSHSVYVFALGLAIYENNSTFRSIYRKAYRLQTKKEAAHHFLRYWGMSSLFHDIGYPFEIPFEQVESYFENSYGKDRSSKPFIAYRNMDALVKISEEEQKHFKTLYGKTFETLDELFAYKLSLKIGKTYNISEERLSERISSKATQPETFGYFMDHAYFSAIRLYLELTVTHGIDAIGDDEMEVLCAILLHNSLYKFVIADNYRTSGKPAFDAKLNPLAWMLMLCDELQCWDRTAYGRQSRKELHPMSAQFDFTNGTINAVYSFDINEKNVINRYEKAVDAWKKEGRQGKAPRLKEYSDMSGEENKFVKDIELIVDLKSAPLTVSVKEEPVIVESKHTYLSGSSFLHLYDFAVAINVRRKFIDHEDEIDVEKENTAFNALSLEYKLLGLNRAKYYDIYLNDIDCFYTDKPVDFKMLTSISQSQLDRIAPSEHGRWLKDRQKMGWVYGDAYETFAAANHLSSEEKAKLREQMRCHKLCMNGKLTKRRIKAHYDTLSQEDKQKDYNAMNSMLKLLKLQEGVRVYSLKD